VVFGGFVKTIILVVEGIETRKTRLMTTKRELSASGEWFFPQDLSKTAIIRTSLPIMMLWRHLPRLSGIMKS